jgi:predicted S18 family serine protease
MSNTFFTYRAVLVIAAMLALAACATPASRPDAALNRAKATVKQASNAGSRNYAAVELNHAESELQSANSAVSDGDYKKARFMAQDAKADAALALAKTRAAKAEKANKQVQKSVQALQRQVRHANAPH